MYSRGTDAIKLITLFVIGAVAMFAFALVTLIDEAMRTYEQIHKERYHKGTPHKVKAVHTSSGVRFAYWTDEVPNERHRNRENKYKAERARPYYETAGGQALHEQEDS